MNQATGLRSGGAAACRRIRQGLTLVLVTFTSLLFAQNGRITGTVTNQATGDLLPGASVVIEGTNVSGASERDGAFSLAAPPGTHTLLVSYAGLDPVKFNMVVMRGINDDEIGDFARLAVDHALHVLRIQSGDAGAFRLTLVSIVIAMAALVASEWLAQRIGRRIGPE